MDSIDRNLHIAIWEWMDSNPGKRNAIDTIIEEFVGDGETEEDVIRAVAFLVEKGNLITLGLGGVQIPEGAPRAEPA